MTFCLFLLRSAPKPRIWNVTSPVSIKMEKTSSGTSGRGVRGGGSACMKGNGGMKALLARSFRLNPQCGLITPL